MTLQERTGLLYIWTAVMLFIALLYLEGGIVRSALVAVFVIISCALGFGRRRLLQASFAVAIVAIAVSFGFPSPGEWPSLAKAAFSECKLKISDVREVEPAGAYPMSMIEKTKDATATAGVET
jgi:hypothetical protein